MPSLNFQKQFAAAVESGEKRQTIRLVRKNPIKAGDKLYLFTGQRTKWSRRLVVQRAVEVIRRAVKGLPRGHVVECTGVEPFSIHHFPDGYAVAVACRELGAEEAEAMAIADGFDEFFGMIDWFEDTHGLPFEGVLIRW